MQTAMCSAHRTSDEEEFHQSRLCISTPPEDLTIIRNVILVTISEAYHSGFANARRVQGLLCQVA